MFLYFNHNERWKKIISKYEEKQKRTRLKIHPVVVLITYYVLSFFILLLASLYRNHRILN